jgi:hypothetical protein
MPFLAYSTYPLLGAFKINADGPRIVAVNSQGEAMPLSLLPSLNVSLTLFEVRK